MLASVGVVVLPDPLIVGDAPTLGVVLGIAPVNVATPGALMAVHREWISMSAYSQVVHIAHPFAVEGAVAVVKRAYSSRRFCCQGCARCDRVAMRDPSLKVHRAVPVPAYWSSALRNLACLFPWHVTKSIGTVEHGQ